MFSAEKLFGTIKLKYLKASIIEKQQSKDKKKVNKNGHCQLDGRVYKKVIKNIIIINKRKRIHFSKVDYPSNHQRGFKIGDLFFRKTSHFHTF